MMIQVTMIWKLKSTKLTMNELLLDPRHLTTLDPDFSNHTTPRPFSGPPHPPKVKYFSLKATVLKLILGLQRSYSFTKGCQRQNLKKNSK